MAERRSRKGPGRPRKELSPEQLEQLEKLAAILTQKQIADFFGISDETLRARMNEDPEIRAIYDRGRAKAIAGVGASVLQKALAGDPVSEKFYLATQAGWSERQHVGHEHEGEVVIRVVFDE